MAPLPVITDVYRCSFNWQDVSTGQHAVNVMHFIDTAGGQTPEDLSISLDANVDPAMLYPVNSDAHANSVDIIPLDGVSPSTTWTLANWDGGGAAGDFVPNAAGVITLKTALRGRSYRGRVFLPFPAEANLTNGLFDATSVGLCVAEWTDFQTDMGTDGFKQVVASYLHATSEDVVSYSMNVAAGTIRKRQSRLR